MKTAAYIQQDSTSLSIDRSVLAEHIVTITRSNALFVSISYVMTSGQFLNMLPEEGSTMFVDREFQ